MNVDTSMLTDTDLKALKISYAQVHAIETLEPNLRAWAWSLCAALDDELEERRATLQATSDQMDEAGGIGEQLHDAVADAYWAAHDAEVERRNDPRNDPPDDLESDQT